MPAIGTDLLGAGAGDMAALVTGVARAGTDIIGVEQEGVIGVKGRITRAMLTEQKLFEEPRGVGAMPFRRTCVRHRLNELIFRTQGRSATLGLIADGEEGFHQIQGEIAGAGEKRWVGGAKGGRSGGLFRHRGLRSRGQNVALANWFPTSPS